MRLITLNRTKPNASIEFYGCPMLCKYCSHTAAAFNDYPLDTVINVLSDNGIRSVFVGGAEPALHSKEASVLVRTLHNRGKEIVLKTTGWDPDFITATKGSVNRYVLEVKTPLDDAKGYSALTSLDEAKAQEQLDKTKRTLELLKGQKVRATLRVIPGHYDVEKVERIAKDLEGYVDEMHLTQFMSTPNDIAYSGILSPGPEQEIMMELAKAARKHIPRVKIKGVGFDETI